MKSRDNFIDWARLGLAVSVCCMHLSRHGYPVWYKPYGPSWAVPGFLAISGFYVLRSYEQSGSWREFIKRRALRIIPAFAVSLVLCALVGGWQTIAPSLAYYASAGNVTTGPVYNGVIWSLGAEEIAYLLLAILFTLGAYKAVWPLWLAFAASCIAASCLCGSQNGDVVRQAAIAPSFFAGSLVYIYRDKLSSVKLGAVLVSIAALAPAALWFTTWNMSSLQWTEGVGMGVGILLLSKVRFPRIPDISYSIYVYHVPLFLLLRTTAGIYFASLFAFCLLSWYLIERPALKLKNWKPRAALCGPELVNASA